MDNSNNRPDRLLPASILIAALLISGSIFYLIGSRNQAGPSGENQLANIGAGTQKPAEISGRDVILGEAEAPVSFIEYGDYQCPFCAKLFNQVEGPLRENFIQTGKVKMVYRNFAFLGPESFAAAEAAECAKDQKQFWAFHDELYLAESKDGAENNGNLNQALFVSIAKKLGLNAAEFESCFSSGKYKSKVVQDSDDARLAGVNSTPTVFVNDQQVAGALPYSQFKSMIENLLPSEE